MSRVTFDPNVTILMENKKEFTMHINITDFRGEIRKPFTFHYSKINSLI